MLVSENFIKVPISHVLLLILAYVLLLSFLFFFRLALLRFKNHDIKYCEIVFERKGELGSHCGVVDKLLALQTRGQRFGSWLHESVG